MVEEITSYRCSICDAEFCDEEEAKRCESQGIPKKKFRKGQRVKSRYQLPESDVARGTGTIIDSYISSDGRGKHTREYEVKFDHECVIRSLPASAVQKVNK